MTRTITCITVGRSDYGLYVPILKKIREDPRLALHLVVAGAHWFPQCGNTVEEIRRDGFDIHSAVEWPVASDTPEGIANCMGTATSAFGRLYAQHRPDMLLVLGDRFEMFAAGAAALPFKIPVAHIHGGELTNGAIDNALRHCVTALAHLHYVATEEYAQRIRQMGEEDWRIVVSGAPALDHLAQTPLLPKHALEEQYGLQLTSPPILVTYHPVTLEYERTEWHIGQLLDALSQCDAPIVFTMPNVDTSHRIIVDNIRTFVQKNPSAKLVPNFGSRGYFSMMAVSRMMVGNSSSGIIESSSFGLPVVNVGTRQEGRMRAGNVIDVGYTTEEITRGIQQAMSEEFASSLAGMHNPYGDGHAADRIVETLATIPLDHILIRKTFVDRLIQHA